MAWEKDLGAFVVSNYVGAASLTAGGTGDATAVTGATIDRDDYQSGVLAVAYKAVLTEAKTLALAVEVQESSDGSTWDTAVALRASTVAATGDTGGSTETGLVEFDIDLSGYKRYVRFNFTPDLNATGTDTAVVAAVFTLGGARII